MVARNLEREGDREDAVILRNVRDIVKSIGTLLSAPSFGKAAYPGWVVKERKDGKGRVGKSTKVMSIGRKVSGRRVVHPKKECLSKDAATAKNIPRNVSRYRRKASSV